MTHLREMHAGEVALHVILQGRTGRSNGINTLGIVSNPFIKQIPWIAYTYLCPLHRRSPPSSIPELTRLPPPPILGLTHLPPPILGLRVSPPPTPTASLHAMIPKPVAGPGTHAAGAKDWQRGLQMARWYSRGQCPSHTFHTCWQQHRYQPLSTPHHCPGCAEYASLSAKLLCNCDGIPGRIPCHCPL